MPRKKQVYNCHKCGRENFRDKFNLQTHISTCNGDVGQALERATKTSTFIDGIAMNFEPMQRSSLQTQSISARLEALSARGVSIVQKILAVNVVDFSEILVAIFRFAWLDDECPEHHHLLGCHDGIHPSECLVFKKGAWRLVSFVTEIRECLNEASLFVYNVEDEIRESMSGMYYQKFEDYRSRIEEITAMATDFETKLMEGMLMPENHLESDLLTLMTKIRTELGSFTKRRSKLITAALRQAEASRDKISPDWLEGGQLYKEAFSNYMKFKDWLPDKPLHKEYLKLIETYKSTLFISRENVDKAVEDFSSVDHEKYRVWKEKYAKSM